MPEWMHVLHDIAGLAILLRSTDRKWEPKEHDISSCSYCSPQTGTSLSLSDLHCH